MRQCIIFAGKRSMLPERMSRFIRKHHVMTLSVCDAGEVWCAHCFYAYDIESNRFVFTSDDDTRHVKIMRKNNRVSVGISLETRIVGKIQGLQLSGTVVKPEGAQYNQARKAYLKRFPYAVLVETSFWFFLPSYAKMTDNALGFGKKLFWSETPDPER